MPSPKTLRRVIIESPYAGDITTHTTYARRCIKDSLLRGEAPIVSHLLYTQPNILDDDIPEERELGIDAGLAWMSVADAIIFYNDYGVSKGMDGALSFITENRMGMKVEERFIGKNP